jgi:uncharacterized membrane protein HdeD (DUF308 family)
LAVALLINPDKSRTFLGNFMGMFWLATGIISLRWGIRGERARGLTVVAGLVGVLAGLGMLGRRFAAGWAAEDVFFSVLGLIVLLTGGMHIFGGFRKGPERRRQRSWMSVLLGVFEAALGVMLVVEPMGRGPAVYVSAGIWALIGGTILIGDALRMRRQGRQAAEPEDEPDLATEP